MSDRYIIRAIVVFTIWGVGASFLGAPAWVIYGIGMLEVLVILSGDNKQ